MKQQRLIVISIFLLALALRIFLIPNRGFEADIAFWKSWGLAAVDKGVIWSLIHTNNNYPTPFAYVLGFLTSLYAIGRNPHYFNEFWNNQNMLFLIIAKLPAILSDLGIAGIILWISKHKKTIGFPDMPFSYYLIFAVLYLFNPLSLIDGAWWGQIDAVGVFLFLIACLLIYHKKPYLGGIIFMLAMMMKLQNMIYGPLFFLLLWQLGRLPMLMQGIAGALIGFLGFNIEFFLNRRMDLVINALTNNYDYFPLLSLNAYNPWWIVSGANGMHVSDKILSIGIIQAKTIGLILFSGSYLLAVLVMLRHSNIVVQWHNGEMAKWRNGAELDTSDRESLFFAFFTSLIIVCSAFFLFQTESHDRYAFPVCVFLLFWGIYYISTSLTEKLRKQWWKTKSFYIFLCSYITFSLIYFCNFHTALAINYPKNSIPFLLFLKEPFWTILFSYIMTGFFLLFLLANKKTVGKPIFLCLFLVCCGIIYGNLPLLTKSPVSLTCLTPTVSKQDYGAMTINMPVNAHGPSKNWNRLSVQYSFYQKGIGTHAKSFITYDLGGHFQRLTTDMGIDTEAGSKGSVVFKIYGDNNLLYTSPIIKRFEYPRHADISITGVKSLSLVVEDADDGITDDHADWLNPQLWP